MKNTNIELAPAPGPELVNDLEVIAVDPEQMATAQKSLVTWCDRQLEALQLQHKELQENLEIARKNKWRTSTIERHTKMAAKRVDYYKKLRAALDAGYLIVPNFPIDAFALRVKRAPAMNESTNQFSASRPQDPQVLPPGVGQYKSPVPIVGSVTREWENPPKTVFRAELFTNVEFPVALVKPRILKETERAMALRVFDEIGVVGQRQTRRDLRTMRGDPIVIGRIYNPKAPYKNKWISFFIAWWFSTADFEA